MKNQKPDKTAVKLNPEKWVDEYGDYLFRYTLIRVRDTNAAEDLVQETFLAALKSSRNFASRSTEKTWLTGILKHKILDYFRKKNQEFPSDQIEHIEQRLEELFDEKGQWKKQPSDWKKNAHQLYEQKEFMAIFYKCMAELKGKIARAFLLRELDGKSTKEICEILDITKSNTWVILHRARMLLRLCLDNKWFGKKTKAGAS